MIVSARPLERALDLALVIDGSPSMLIWDDTFDEFERLLYATGALHSVSRWRLVLKPTRYASGIRMGYPILLAA